MFRNSGFDAPISLSNWSWNIISHHGVFGVAPLANCFKRSLEHSLVDSLENIRLLIMKRTANCFQRQFPFLFVPSAFPGLTRYPKLCEEFFSLLVLRATKLSGLAFEKIVGFCFAVGEPSFEVAS